MAPARIARGRRPDAAAALLRRQRRAADAYHEAPEVASTDAGRRYLVRGPKENERQGSEA